MTSTISRSTNMQPATRNRKRNSKQPAAPPMTVMEKFPTAKRIAAARLSSPTKIDWDSKGHSGSSMIRVGVYPKGTTREEVEAKVRGTVGGRFEQFGGGEFRYIAYTD